MMRHLRILLPVVLLVTVTSCRGGQQAEVHTPGVKSRTTVVEIEPLAPEFRPAAGQTIYVPAYASIFISDNAHPFDLAVTLSVRNTDQKTSMILTSARFYDHDGRLVRDYLKKPLRVGPRASIEYFVSERDTSGGVSASFFVEWVSEQPVSSPVVESVMVGTAGNQGVSFTCPGRVLTDRGLTGPRPPMAP
jgi:hypothetical protein